MDEDRLAELEQMLKDASDNVMETEKRFAEAYSLLCINGNCGCITVAAECHLTFELC